MDVRNRLFKRVETHTLWNLNNIYIGIHTHLIHHIKSMNVSRWHATFIAVKVAPERSSQVIKVASTHIDIAGFQGGSTQFLQKGVDIPDRVEDVTAYDNVSFQIGGGILPGC